MPRSSQKPKKLNIFGLTQGGNIDIFLSMVEDMKQQGHPIGSVGALVSFAAHYKSSEAVKAMGKDLHIIKEWEVL